jgi:hypothetical protein
VRSDFIVAALILGAAIGAASYFVVQDYNKVRDSLKVKAVRPEPSPAAPPAPTSQPRRAVNDRNAAPSRQFSPQTRGPVTSRRGTTGRTNTRGGGRRGQPPGDATNAPINEPAARQALLQVGASAAAERIWEQAINDTSLGANARRNLIEDLNETGFQNPRNLTMNDLPLIENRIALIERLAPDAIDDVNSAAFDEAYRDLLNMRGRLVGP